MNQKGFSVVAGIILGLVILSAVVVGGALVVRTLEKTKEGTVFELDNIQIGDSVAGMRIRSLDTQPPQPKKEGDFFVDIRTADIGFSGKATISGQYLINELDGCPGFVIDQASSDQLPTLRIKYRSQFGDYNFDTDEFGATKVRFLCLSGRVEKLDFQRGGYAKIVIDNLTLHHRFFPTERTDDADLIEVLEDQPNEQIEIASFFGSIQLDQDDLNQRWLLIHDVPTFEGERSPAALTIVDTKNGTAQKIDNIGGFLLLPGGKTALISKVFDVEPRDKMRGDPGYDLDKNKVAQAVSEIGVSEAALRTNVYPAGGKPSAEVAALFTVDLETEKQESLKLFGGRGGIFKLQDGTIYLSNGGATASYLRGIPVSPGGLFGVAPYSLYNLQTRSLTKLSDDFMPDLTKVFRPLTRSSSPSFNLITIVGSVNFSSRDNKFFVTFRKPLAQ